MKNTRNGETAVVVFLFTSYYEISSDLLCERDNVRFTTVPFNTLIGQLCGRYCRFLGLNMPNSDNAYMLSLQ